MASIEELEASINARLEQRAQLPVRLQNDMARLDKAKLGELFKEQLIKALEFLTFIPEMCFEDAIADYEEERQRLRDEWEGDTLYSEAIMDRVDGELVEVGRTLPIRDKYYARHMGSYVALSPWWAGDYGLGENAYAKKREEMLLDNRAVRMKNGGACFTLDAVRDAMVEVGCDDRLTELSDHKLTQLVRALGCIRMRLELETDGHRKRYLSVWRTRPAAPDTMLGSEVPPPLALSTNL